MIVKDGQLNIGNNEMGISYIDSDGNIGIMDRHTYSVGFEKSNMACIGTAQVIGVI